MLKVSDCTNQESLTETVNLLTPHELIKELSQNKLNVDGKLEVIRDRLVRFYMKKIYYHTLVRWNPTKDEQQFDEQLLADETNAKVTSTNGDNSSTRPPSSFSHSVSCYDLPDSTISLSASNLLTNTIKHSQGVTDNQTLNKISNDIEPILSAIEMFKIWNLSFVGQDSEDCSSFLNNLEECKACINLPEDVFLRLLPIVLNGSALSWFRLEGRAYTTWASFAEAFKKKYESSDYRRQLCAEIRNRTQGPNETVSNFLKHLRYIYDKFDPPVPVRNQLNMAYKNLHPHFHVYLKREQFTSYNVLEKLGSRIESIYPRIQLNYNLPPTAGKCLFPEAAYNYKKKNSRDESVKGKGSIMSAKDIETIFGGKVLSDRDIFGEKSQLRRPRVSSFKS